MSKIAIFFIPFVLLLTLLSSCSETSANQPLETSTPAIQPDLNLRPNPVMSVTPSLPPALTVEPTQEKRSNMKEYHSSDGNFDISYPLEWRATEKEGEVEFSSPEHAAWAVVRFRKLEKSVTNSELADNAVAYLKEKFEDRYEEERRALQADRSIGVDFHLLPTDTDDTYFGKLFVERRGLMAYELHLFIPLTNAKNYQHYFNFMITSYHLPKHEVAEDNNDPEWIYTRFCYDLAAALNDPEIVNPAGLLVHTQRLVSYVNPNQRKESETAFTSVLSEYGEKLSEYRSMGSDIRVRASVVNLRTSLLSKDEKSATIDLLSGSLAITYEGIDVASLIPDEDRSFERPLSSFLGQGDGKLSFVFVNNGWFINFGE